MFLMFRKFNRRSCVRCCVNESSFLWINALKIYYYTIFCEVQHKIVSREIKARCLELNMEQIYSATIEKVKINFSRNILDQWHQQKWSHSRSW